MKQATLFRYKTIFLWLSHGIDYISVKARNYLTDREEFILFTVSPRDGLHLFKGVPSSLGFPIDNSGKVIITKENPFIHFLEVTKKCKTHSFLLIDIDMTQCQSITLSSNYTFRLDKKRGGVALKCIKEHTGSYITLIDSNGIYNYRYIDEKLNLPLKSENYRSILIY